MARKPDPEELYARRLRAHNPRRRTTDERIALSLGGAGGGRMPAAPATPNGGGTPYGAMAMLAMQQQMGVANGQPTSDGGAPYPNMPKVSMTTPPKGMMGATGTAILSGVIQNDSKGEYNPDWYWRDFIPIIDQMRRSDGQIQAIEQTIRQPIERATWSIQPATDDGVDQIIASFVESALLEGMVDTSRDGDPVRTTWRETLQQILSFLWYGFMVFELVYTDPRKDPDGYVKFARWVPLLPRTVWRWWTNADNDLVGIQQWTYRDFAFKFVNIRAGKLLRFHHRMEGSNYDGWPLFRSAYPHWFAKTNLLNIAAVGAERNSIAPPWFRLPHVSATDTDYQTALKIAQNIRANEQLAVVTPDDWTLEYLKAGNGELEHVLKLVEYHDQLIARSVLAQFLNLGGSRGAYNLDASQKLTFLSALQSVAEYICDVINTDAIKRIVDYNFAGVTVYPKLVCSKLVSQDITLLSQAMQTMAPYFPPSPELNDFLARELGLPATPQSFVQTTNPGTPGGGGPQGQGGDQGDQQQGQQGQDSGQEGAYDNTSGAPYENGTDNSGGGGASEGYGEELDGLREEARLLREALDAAYGVDAVERAEAHEMQAVRLYDPQHKPKGSPGAGQFDQYGNHGQHVSTGTGRRAAAGAKKTGEEAGGGGGKKGGGTRSTRAPRKPKEPTAADHAKADEMHAAARKGGKSAGGGSTEEAGAKAGEKTAREANVGDRLIHEGNRVRVVEKLPGTGNLRVERTGKVPEGELKSYVIGGSEQVRAVAARASTKAATAAKTTEEAGAKAAERAKAQHEAKIARARAQFEAASKAYGAHMDMMAQGNMQEAYGVAAHAEEAMRLGRARDRALKALNKLLDQNPLQEATPVKAKADEGARKTTQTEQRESKATAAKSAITLAPVGHVDESMISPYGPPNAHVLRTLYGDNQLEAALGRHTPTDLRGTARGLGVSASGSKAALIQRIAKAVREVSPEESQRIANGGAAKKD